MIACDWLIAPTLITLTSSVTTFTNYTTFTSINASKITYYTKRCKTILENTLNRANHSCQAHKSSISRTNIINNIYTNKNNNKTWGTNILWAIIVGCGLGRTWAWFPCAKFWMLRQANWKTAKSTYINQSQTVIIFIHCTTNTHLMNILLSYEIGCYVLLHNDWGYSLTSNNAATRSSISTPGEALAMSWEFSSSH